MCMKNVTNTNEMVNVHVDGLEVASSVVKDIYTKNIPMKCAHAMGHA